MVRGPHPLSASPRQTLKTTDLPSYPKAFIATARLSRERDRAFVAMPFGASHSDALWKVIQAVCAIRGMTATRGDTPRGSDVIVADILRELEAAEIVIA